MTTESQRVEAIRQAIINCDCLPGYALDYAKAAIAADPLTEEYAKLQAENEEMRKMLEQLGVVLSATIPYSYFE